MLQGHYSTFPGRIQSFKSSWKTVGKLSPTMMARAGFYYLGSSDSVKCYYCEKELEGWEENDDPFVEHRNHQPLCPYIIMFTEPPEFITLKQCLELEHGRLKFKLEKQIKDKIDKIMLVSQTVK